MPTNRKLFDLFQEDLSNRIEYEKKLARIEQQRFCEDRPKTNNNPWPKASNVRYPLSDTILAQKKAFFYKVLFSSSQVANFKGLNPQMALYNELAAGYFDYVIKEMTNFESEIQFAADAGLQDGECLMGVIWDSEKQAPHFIHVDNLFCITPTSAKDLHSTSRLVRIIQTDEQAMRASERFKKLGSKLDELFNKIRDNEDNQRHDTGGREEDRYDRQGISRSYKNGVIVLWETHYLDEETQTRRIRTLSPDDPDFDFEDDQSYPYDFADKNKQWFINHYRREMLDKNLHSSRGVPELVQEGEHSLSAMWRAKHNAMTLYNNPGFSAPNGIGDNTQNVGMLPGQIYPYELIPMQQGQPPISWDIEMQQTREVFERRAATPDYGIGQSNTMNDSRTKFEVQQISNMQGLAADLETGNWRAFIRQLFKQAWALMVQFLREGENQSFKFFLDNAGTEIPLEAFTNEYMISVSGSAEAVNKEFQLQKAQSLLEAAMKYGDPRSVFAAWKNFVSYLEPTKVHEFAPDPQGAEQQATDKAMSDMSVIKTTLYPIVAKPGDDFFAQARAAVQFLMVEQQQSQKTGRMTLTPEQIKLISNYIASNREALKQTNRQKYNELTSALDQMDQQAAQQMQAQAQAQTQAQGMIPPPQAMQPGMIPTA